MFRSGDQIGPYTLVNKLGKGAFGVVWLAERRTQITTTNAAIKIPLDEEISIETIKNEADLWVRASGHPNVLPIIEADIYGEYVIIASEYAPDGSLDAFLKKNGKAPTIDTAVEIVSGILAGLEHLHSRNIIHRDLKPANILFQGNTPRLADFGISRVLKSTSHSSTVAGTPLYMAPEAFDGKRNAQTDIWSVGAIFYQLLSGRLPFAREDLPSLVKAILMHDPEPLPRDVPTLLQNVVAKALTKDTNSRYKSAAEMRKTLRSLPGTNVESDFQTDDFATTVRSPVKTYSPQPTKKTVTPQLISANGKSFAGVKKIATILGIIFILFGTIGFFFRNLFGAHLSPSHNFIHLVSGALALYFGLKESFHAVKLFCLISGLVYLLLLGVGGFLFGAGERRTLVVIAGRLELGTMDHIIHIALGAIFLIGALLTKGADAAADAD